MIPRLCFSFSSTWWKSTKESNKIILVLRSIFPLPVDLFADDSHSEKFSFLLRYDLFVLNIFYLRFVGEEAEHHESIECLSWSSDEVNCFFLHRWASSTTTRERRMKVSIMQRGKLLKFCRLLASRLVLNQAVKGEKLFGTNLNSKQIKKLKLSNPSYYDNVGRDCSALLLVNLWIVRSST